MQPSSSIIRNDDNGVVQVLMAEAMNVILVEGDF
jgi:hypothetical protein